MEIVSDIIMMPIDKIVPYEKNPRRNSKTVELLCEILPEVGFNVPLVLDENNVIVKGHARYLAAQRLGMTEVPCVISHASPDEIKADRIADNKVFEFSTWVQEELQHEVDMLDLNFDPEKFGLPKLELPDMEFDFDFDDDDDEYEIDDAERRRRFAELMAQMEQEEADVQIVTQNQIDNARGAQRDVVKEPPKYFAVTCDKCGYTGFVREGDALVWE